MGLGKQDHPFPQGRMEGTGDQRRLPEEARLQGVPQRRPAGRGVQPGPQHRRPHLVGSTAEN